MNTIKINGGGPLWGKTFYATGGFCIDDKAILSLDENPFPEAPPPKLEATFVFSCITGYLIMNDYETDLLKVDASDLAKLWF